MVKKLNIKDLLIKSMKCKNSEFDDNPEITAYIQVKDISNKKKMMFMFLMIGCFHQAHQLNHLIILFMIFGLLIAIKLFFHYQASLH